MILGGNEINYYYVNGVKKYIPESMIPWNTIPCENY